MLGDNAILPLTAPSFSSASLLLLSVILFVGVIHFEHQQMSQHNGYGRASTEEYLHDFTHKEYGTFNRDDEKLDSCSSYAKYDLPRLLNVQSFLPQKSGHNGEEAIAPNSSAVMQPQSIIAFYQSLPERCTRRPDIRHLRIALDRYASQRDFGFTSDEARAMENDTLVVHISTAPGSNLTETFMADVLNRAKLFRSVLLMSFCAENVENNGLTSLMKLTKFLEGKDITVNVHKSMTVDGDLYLMYVSLHLLVHRGRFSALGALACNGTVYYTDEMKDYMTQNQFRWLLKNAQPARGHANDTHVVVGHMGKVVPTCCKFEAFGKGDGEKIICANARAFKREPCWVLSVGCSGRWSFERSIMEKTTCKIHTFDCTGTWPVPSDLQERVTLHKVCLGRENDTRPNFIGWNEMIEIGSGQSKMKPESKLPALAKMDIEGHEFPVLRELVLSGKEEILPEQLAVEIHSVSLKGVGPPFVMQDPVRRREIVSGEVVTELFHNLSTRGYQLAHRADNPFCNICSEVTLVRTNGLPKVD